MKLHRCDWDSPLGRLHLVANDHALLCLAFEQNLQECHQRLGLGECCSTANAIIEQALGELEEYFAGKRREFSVQISLAGTPFQMRAWEALRAVPYGATISYQAQARALGLPGAVRATGTANGRNPIAIIVPCHRVVRSNGALGGYAGGVEFKNRLLRLEAEATGLRLEG
jgi:methylated-DNA-[protein]-cysteine S-methyltransferase